MEEIKQGYKQTDIGLIPEDWEVLTIGELCSISIGKDVEFNKFSNNTNSEYPYPVYSNTVENYGLYGYYKTPQYSDSAVTVVGRGIGLGTAFARFNKFGAIGRLIVLSQKKYFNPTYLSSYINSQIEIFSESGGIPQLTRISFSKYLIAIPSNSYEQTTIATALSDTDALIAALDKKIAKKQQIKQGAMQQLLTGKKRLPGFDGEWVEKRLGECTAINRGGSPRPIEKYLTNDVKGINWIKIGDVGVNAKYIESTEEKIIEEGVSKSRYVKKGDFLLSNSMSFGRPYILNVDGCIHDGWLVIQNYHETFDTNYLYYILGFESTLNQYKSVAAGSSVLNLNKQIVSNVIISCPHKSEQTAIAQILTDMDQEIALLEKERYKYVQLKAGMMQVLLTGKVRLVTKSAKEEHQEK